MSLLSGLFGAVTPFDGALDDLGDVVSAPAFKAINIQYFERFCEEFDETEENKLSYTTMHNEYQQVVEQTIEESLGAEKYKILCDGLEEHLASGKQDIPSSDKAAAAMDVLHSVTDFQKFKTVMLARRNAQRAGRLEVQQFQGVLDVEDAMNRCKELAQAASEADGWTSLIDEDGMSMLVKPQEGTSAQYLRYTIALPLPVDQAWDAFVNFTSESLQWRDKVKSMTQVKEFGPGDNVVMMESDIPTMVKWAMNIPDVMSVRCVTRRDWPSPGEHAYSIVPYDLENDMCVESMGVLKIKTGIVSAHPNDPQLSMVTGSDLIQLPALMPNFALGMMMKKTVPAQMTTMAERYKAAKGL